MSVRTKGTAEVFACDYCNQVTKFSELISCGQNQGLCRECFSLSRNGPALLLGLGKLHAGLVARIEALEHDLDEYKKVITLVSNEAQAEG